MVGTEITALTYSCRIRLHLINIRTRQPSIDSLLLSSSIASKPENIEMLFYLALYTLQHNIGKCEDPPPQF